VAKLKAMLKTNVFNSGQPIMASTTFHVMAVGDGVPHCSKYHPRLTNITTARPSGRTERWRTITTETRRNCYRGQSTTQSDNYKQQHYKQSETQSTCCPSLWQWKQCFPV